MQYPLRPIVYSDVLEKNILEKKMFKPLSPQESLVHTLNMMDLFASMRKRPHHPDDDKYPLNILKKEKMIPNEIRDTLRKVARH